jgi:hypothetical protein
MANNATKIPGYYTLSLIEESSFTFPFSLHYEAKVGSTDGLSVNNTIENFLEVSDEFPMFAN